MTAYLWNQSELQTITIYKDVFGLLLLYSDLKKKSFGEKPLIDLFLRHLSYMHPESM